MTNGKRFLSFFLITAFVVAAGPAAAQTADVLVIHNSPDPAAEVVDVYLDGTLAVPGFAFQTAGVVELPAGTEIEIGIAPGPGSEAADIIATFPFTLTAGESYVVMATGVLDSGLPSNPDGIDTGFTLVPFEGWRTSAAAGESACCSTTARPMRRPSTCSRATSVRCSRVWPSRSSARPTWTCRPTTTRST
jgi:hypothetical protein